MIVRWVANIDSKLGRKTISEDGAAGYRTRSFRVNRGFRGARPGRESTCYSYGTGLVSLHRPNVIGIAETGTRAPALRLNGAVSVVSCCRVYLAIVACLLVILALGAPVQVWAAGSELDRMSTPERVNQQPWWPTKLLPTRNGFVGSQVCAKCHVSIAASARNSEMAKALLRPDDVEVLRKRDGQTFELESYLYTLERKPQGQSFTVKRGSESFTQPIDWAFGDGNIAQVYVTEKQGISYESHFSYYSGIDGFDRTTNQPQKATSIKAAVGRVMSASEARKCFACHASAVTATGGYDDITPGVTCEACHGPGADHVAAMKAGLEGGEGFILNPRRLDRNASVDFCGACHMTWIDVQLGDKLGPPTVRFPAYRLLNSRCWEKGDKRITCVGCHDPHQPLARSSAYYDLKCLGCHVTAATAMVAKDHPGKACPRSDHNCVSCHMPKQDFPDTHYSFTDHDIRIVRAGESPPE
jgi:Cytochrome c554 and c-prime